MNFFELSKNKTSEQKKADGDGEKETTRRDFLEKTAKIAAGAVGLSSMEGFLRKAGASEEKDLGVEEIEKMRTKLIEKIDDSIGSCDYSIEEWEKTKEEWEKKFEQAREENLNEETIIAKLEIKHSILSMIDSFTKFKKRFEEIKKEINELDLTDRFSSRIINILTNSFSREVEILIYDIKIYGAEYKKSKENFEKKL